MNVRWETVPVGLAVLQLADAAGNAVVPRRIVDAHLDHLAVPPVLRPTLPWIKVLSSTGLIVGTKAPKLGALTSGLLVGSYAAAIGFHRRAGDRALVAVPAALFG